MIKITQSRSEVLSQSIRFKINVSNLTRFLSNKRILGIKCPPLRVSNISALDQDTYYWAAPVPAQIKQR